MEPGEFAVTVRRRDETRILSEEAAHLLGIIVAGAYSLNLPERASTSYAAKLHVELMQGLAHLEAEFDELLEAFAPEDDPVLEDAGPEAG